MTSGYTSAAVIFAACLGAAGAVQTTPAAAESEASAAVRLRDAEPSIDSLLAKFQQALADKDKVLLRRLRVTEDEYRNFIMPGSVPEGQPRAHYSEQDSQYFWGTLNGKSIYSEANLLAEFGGRPLKLTSVSYRKGIQHYRDYTAYKQLVVTVEDAQGTKDMLKIGSIAEVAGGYKFISFVRD